MVVVKDCNLHCIQRFDDIKAPKKLYIFAGILGATNKT